MTPRGQFGVTVPKVSIPVVFRFWDRDIAAQPNHDTVNLEPCRNRIILAWRVRVTLGRKIHALREIIVGPRLAPRRKSLKPHFTSIPELVEWKNRKNFP
jgi:hypothetical protein